MCWTLPNSIFCWITWPIKFLIYLKFIKMHANFIYENWWDWSRKIHRKSSSSRLSLSCLNQVTVFYVSSGKISIYKNYLIFFVARNHAVLWTRIINRFQLLNRRLPVPTRPVLKWENRPLLRDKFGRASRILRHFHER